MDCKWKNKTYHKIHRRVKKATCNGHVGRPSTVGVRRHVDHARCRLRGDPIGRKGRLNVVWIKAWDVITEKGMVSEIIVLMIHIRAFAAAAHA